MTVMRILAHGGRFLTYDTDDVENINVQTPNDKIDVTKDGDKFARYRLGRAHLDLHIDFKEGKRPLWLMPDEAETAEKLAEGRKMTALLEEALREELVPAHIVWRIVNRFVHGNPDGPTARPLEEMQLTAEKVDIGRMDAMLSDEARARIDQLPDVSIPFDSVVEREAHRCTEACVCPADGKPMYYWPVGDVHACYDVECRYAHPARPEEPR
jgi:hypothetical protein